jgi:hypothetical protein
MDNKEYKIYSNTKTNEFYFDYDGNTITSVIEFYKKDATTPFSTRAVIITKKDDGTYATNLAPSIAYGDATEKTRKITISDGGAINKIEICKINQNKEFDYKEENIIYRYSRTDSKDDKTTADYINNVEISEDGKKINITFNKLDEYGYYEIRAVDKKTEIVQKREIRIQCLYATAKAEVATNSFIVIPTVVNTDESYAIFKIDKSDKITKAEVYQILNGKVQTKTISDYTVEKNTYITQVKIAKEGMFRIKYTNKDKEEYSVDCIIKKEETGWNINQSPKVKKATLSSDNQKIIVTDNKINTMQILLYNSDTKKYDKELYSYKDGKGTKGEDYSKYISSLKITDTKKVTIEMKRKSSTYKIKIIATDINVDNVSMIRARKISIKKKATTKSTTSSSSSKNTTSNNTTSSSKNTTSSNTSSSSKNTTSSNTTSSSTNSKTVFSKKLESGNPTKEGECTYRFSAKDNDGIKTITYKVYRGRLDCNGKKVEETLVDATTEVNGKTEYSFGVSIRTYYSYKVQIKVTDSKGNVESITYTEF